MKTEAFVGFGLLLTSLCAQAIEGAQPAVSVTEMKGKIPAESAYIVKYYVDKPSPGSGYDTGNLHIVYSDKTEVVQALPPKEKSTEKVIVDNQEGITDIKVAPDKRTIGWAETFDNCCTSYSIPIVLAIYESGNTVLHIQQGRCFGTGRSETAGSTSRRYGGRRTDPRLVIISFMTSRQDIWSPKSLAIRKPNP
jgi:hypothetical protein